MEMVLRGGAALGGRGAAPASCDGGIVEGVRDSAAAGMVLGPSWPTWACRVVTTSVPGLPY